jgi:hypothetical protein
MKIEPQTSSLEYNPEVQVKMTLSELKTIITLIGSIAADKVGEIIDYSKSKGHMKYLQDDDVESRINLSWTYHSMKEQYLAIPKKPKFQPLTVTIESEEELIALRIATGKLNGSIIRASLHDSGINHTQEEVDKIWSENYAMFRVFDKIFEGQVK